MKYVFINKPAYGQVFYYDNQKWVFVKEEFQRKYLINIDKGYVYLSSITDDVEFFSYVFTSGMMKLKYKESPIFTIKDDRCIKMGDYIRCELTNKTYLVSRCNGGWILTDADGHNIKGFAMTEKDVTLQRIQQSLGGGYKFSFVKSFEE